MGAALLSLAASLLRLVPIVGAWFVGRRSARDAANAKALEQARTAQAIDEDVARLDDAALHDELRGRG
ncbi:MAG: hypothetical protein HZA67_03520 [Rhodospirillales bacterium]|jgi:hypothetical protein|nr:hypothetical protein [Rhodospirillales bacterium]